MTLQQVQDLTIEQIKQIPTPQLRRIVQQTATTLNKRIINIKYTKSASQISVKAVKETGGKFKSTYKITNAQGKKVSRPMQRRDLIAELKREKNFMKGAASTVKKAKQFKKKQQETAGGQTADSYAKKKAREARRERSKQIQAENRAKGITKMSKKQKSELDKLYRQKYKEASERYDKAVEEAWDAYHNWKEINQIESKAIFDEGKTIQDMVISTAFNSDNARDEYFKNQWEKYIEEDEEEYVKSQESQPDLGNPFNLKQRMKEIARKKSEVDEIADLIDTTGGIILH